MDKSKLLALLSAASGITYAEWELVKEHIDRGFQQKLNRTELSAGELQEISGRMQVELEAYFR